ncbi:MAG: ribbon-helix-helix domain-containing protein [Microthrixaceae bacterium]
MTTQIAVKLPEALLESVDDLVRTGRMKNRSAAVRAGLELLSRSERESAIDRAFNEGVRRFPDSEREVENARRLAIESIEEEPWEPWW